MQAPFFFFHGEGQLSWFYGPPSLLSIYIVEIGALSMHGAGATKDISAENFPPAMLLWQPLWHGDNLCNQTREWYQPGSFICFPTLPPRSQSDCIRLLWVLRGAKLTIVFLISNFQLFLCCPVCWCSFFFVCVKICCVLEESLTGSPFLPNSKDDRIPGSFCGCSTVRFRRSSPGGRRTFPHYNVEYPYCFQCVVDTNWLSSPFS